MNIPCHTASCGVWKVKAVSAMLLLSAVTVTSDFCTASWPYCADRHYEGPKTPCLFLLHFPLLTLPFFLLAMHLTTISQHILAPPLFFFMSWLFINQPGRSRLAHFKTYESYIQDWRGKKQRCGWNSDYETQIYKLQDEPCQNKSCHHLSIFKNKFSMFLFFSHGCVA